MKIQSLKEKKIIYREKTSDSFKHAKLFMEYIGVVFIVIGCIFLIILFFGQILFGTPSTTPLGISAGIGIFFVGIGFILIGVIYIVRGKYTIVDLTIYENGIVLPNRPLKYIFKKEIDFISFDELEKIYLNANGIPQTAYLSKEQLLTTLPKYIPQALRKKVNNNEIKALKLRKGFGIPKNGDVIILLKSGCFEIISEIDIENKDSFKKTIEKFLEDKNNGGKQ